jgi:exonuclease V
MKQGTRIHKAREEEVHTTVPVDIVTKEDKWGLRIWNVIQGLRTLRDTGRTRELEIWGIIGGEIVNGIVDELSYDCPDPKLEAEIDERYANVQKAKDALPEYQTTITAYLLSSASGGTQNTSEAGDPETKTESQQRMPPPPVPGKEKQPLVYISDIKTRSVKTLPAGASIRPTIMQLHLYHHMVENLTHGNFPLQVLADRYKLDTNSPFSDSFIVQVGSLNQEFFDTVTEQIGASEDRVTASQIASSQDSTDLLLRHNNLSSLWSFMIQQFQSTFLLDPKFSIPGTPSSTPQSIQDTPTSSTRLSPILTATYLSSKTSELLGSKSILFDASLLKDYLEDNLSWWKGERSARGVELQEAWKCRSCDFRDDCGWIHERDAAALAEAKARKKMREIAGVEVNPSKSEI